ncbi:hypothetical protein SAMN02745229_00361 [Butyrivibrio fibrisolvens DSM 3071]|uniref:Uncharacterized protein n=1 Tax=Butyrivibrio fibrisolvens DSM 3071 TaxID=1121131 RepID=A0A1M5SQ96_BUTFI|nr:hypothetical protein SAMN02745229_00361 [Butyrivibrio fibrisolvens DSM 3071]
MSNNYNEYCMKFSNEEIEEYLINSILEKGKQIYEYRISKRDEHGHKKQ